jgi:hypothetical protein
MKTLNLKTSVTRAIVAGAAVPALLVSGAGTAHASVLDVSLDPWPGGLTVHVRHASPMSNWCTYTADWYQSPRFHLVSGAYDLVIFPSVPENRNWDVRVACDDGAVVRMTKFY